MHRLEASGTGVQGGIWVASPGSPCKVTDAGPNPWPTHTPDPTPARLGAFSCQVLCTSSGLNSLLWACGQFETK